MAEIKIRELSIGDWVMNLYANKPSRVIGLRPMFQDTYEIITVSDGTQYMLIEDKELHNYEPIPLTPEILEKNGFVKWQGGLVLIGDEISCRYEDGNLSIEQGYRDNEGVLVERLLVNIERLSVHQLQHALRLAGVGKEIEV